MADSNDHDLLVTLNTKVEMLLTSQAAFILATNVQTKELAERVARLEVKDSRDSEKVQTISDDVRRSLANSARIETLASDAGDFGKWKEKIDGRAWQIWLAILLTLITSVLGLILK